MKNRMTVAVMGMVLAMATAGWADVFNMGGTRNADGSWNGLASLETVPVGNPGNTGEGSGESYGGYGPDRICGSVGYAYNIGKYEVTAGQYTEFLNAVAKTDMYGLYNTSMDAANDSYGCNIKQSGSSGSYMYTVGNGSPTDVANWANRPVNYVSFWDTCRFANWLHNGQPTGAEGTGTTETGAYTLTTDGMNNNTIVRNADARWAVTSEDEWYKAAYYNPATDTYFEYSTGSDMINTGMANYGWSVGYTTDVGTYDYPSPYGTFDQTGNLFEWNEEIGWSQQFQISARGQRGGSFRDFGLNASYRDIDYPTLESNGTGFRVSEVPEPASTAVLALGGLGMLVRRKI